MRYITWKRYRWVEDFYEMPHKRGRMPKCLMKLRIKKPLPVPSNLFELIKCESNYWQVVTEGTFIKFDVFLLPQKRIILQDSIEWKTYSIAGKFSHYTDTAKPYLAASKKKHARIHREKSIIKLIKTNQSAMTTRWDFSHSCIVSVSPHLLLTKHSIRETWFSSI